MRLEFHPEAELELIEAAVHYELQVPGLGRRLEAEIRRATDLLLQQPEIGPPVDPDLRKFILARFPVLFLLSGRIAHAYPRALRGRGSKVLA